MGDDEKKLQLADAVTEYQAAKVDYAHISQKLERVFAAYKEVGEQKVKDLEAVHSSLRLVEGKIRFFVGAKCKPEDLMNETELTALLADRERIIERVKKARSY